MTAVLIAVAANFVLGYVWYTFIFGKAWAAEMKMDMNKKPAASAMIRGMIMMVIGSFLMAYVFAHNIAVWNPVTWGQAASAMTAGETAGKAAFFTWLGFYMPGDLSRVAWDGHSWKLFFINTAYHFVSLLITAYILVSMP